MPAKRGHKVRIVNASINRDPSAGMLVQPNHDTPDGTRLVVLQTGTNDGGEAGHDETIAAITERPRERSIEVLWLETRSIGDLRATHTHPDRRHLTAEGYRIPTAVLLPQAERDRPG